MIKWIALGGLAVSVVAFAEPAQAQYRFDPRIDPSACRWNQVCDYGGRAYRPRAIKVRNWRSPCRMITVREVGPNNTVIVRRERRCALSVRG